MPIVYQSKSGQSFTFQKYNFYDTAWYQGVSGVYIFARYEHLSNTYQCIYIGETDSFGRRMNEHKQEKWPKAVSFGANTVLAVVVPYEWTRIALEKELIHRYPTILNKKDNPLNQPPQLGLGGITKNTPSPYGLADLVKDNPPLQQGLGILKYRR